MARYTQYVHEFTDKNGRTRWAVAQWDEEKGQYFRPYDHSEAKLTGGSGEVSRFASAMQSYPTRKRALARARYLFHEDEEYKRIVQETEQWAKDNPEEMARLRAEDEARLRAMDEEISRWVALQAREGAE